MSECKIETNVTVQNNLKVIDKEIEEPILDIFFRINQLDSREGRMSTIKFNVEHQRTTDRGSEVGFYRLKMFSTSDINPIMSDD